VEHKINEQQLMFRYLISTGEEDDLQFRILAFEMGRLFAARSSMASLIPNMAARF
jgi:hypothetical protein